ncbi:MAG: aspartate-semialdehyde dehydrogenase [Myxococcota bacterium]
MAEAPKVAVVGVTGVVGREMLRVLEQREFRLSSLVPVASIRSAGQKVRFRGVEQEVLPIAPNVFEDVDIALFSAGSSTSQRWSPVAASKGATVIDNSSAFRMDPDVPLCIPEINLEATRRRPKGIIANPNCSTIQMLVALAPLHRESRVRRIIVSTYQAISGSGARAVEAFKQQQQDLLRNEAVETSSLKGQLAGSLLMHWAVDTASGYQEEELKMVHETRKILDDPEIAVSPTCVRVPVECGHAESIAIETTEHISLERAQELLRNAPGVRFVEDFEGGNYPTPLDVIGRDEVYVGRLRADLGNPSGLLLWVVADNLRKGAALNAVQIAEAMV